MARFPISMDGGLERAAQTLPTDQDALALGTLSTEALCVAARARRARGWGESQLTFSPKVFLPVTNLCRNRCKYCAFRRSPGDPGEWTMTPQEVVTSLDEGQRNGCVEALLCLGDVPRGSFPAYHAMLVEWGFRSTVDYLAWIGERALERGLVAHTNAGILTKDEMAQLKPTNASLGLMLESMSERLTKRGEAHFNAPDKRPSRRVAMIEGAGELSIPFTTGVLVGIGETEDERVETLLEIRRMHEHHGHVQEVIVQNFVAHDHTAMQSFTQPTDDAFVRAVALARLILPDEVSVQAPPNLSPNSIGMLIDAGLNDFGGISPVTPDFINPEYPWPHLRSLRDHCRTRGFELVPRLPVYPAYAADARFCAAELQTHLRAAAARLLAWSWTEDQEFAFAATSAGATEAVVREPALLRVVK